jgi:hypothetical protein
MVNKVDDTSMQFMKHMTRKCQKLKSGHICFSPESVICIQREQIYILLVAYNQEGNKIEAI